MRQFLIKGLSVASVLCLGAGQFATNSAYATTGQLRSGVKVLAWTDEPTPAGGTYRFLSRPVMNNNGEVGFTASLNGVSNNRAVFQGTDVNDVGSVAAGTDYGRSLITIDSLGQVGYAGDKGYWLGTPGSATRFVAEPGFSPTILGGLNFNDLNILSSDGRFRQANDGTVAFIAEASVGSNDFRLVAGPINALVQVAGTGTPAPGIPGATFGLTSSFSEVSASSGGYVAFTDTLSGASVTSADEDTIWSGTPGNIQLVMRQGGQAPGFGPGDYYGNQISDPKVNASGQVVFESNVFGPGTVSGDKGLFVGTPGNIQLLARKGDVAAGPMGGAMNSFNWPVINNDGDVALSSTIDGDDVFVTNSSGSFEVVAREGALAAGTTGDVRYGSLPRRFTFNNAGQVLFSTTLTGGDALPGDFGLWRYDPDGTVTLLLRDGDLIELEPGDQRELDTIFRVPFDNVGGDDGYGSEFNDSGQAAVLAVFKDGTEAVIVVPEPVSLAMLAMSAGLLLGRRRRGSVSR